MGKDIESKLLAAFGQMRVDMVDLTTSLRGEFRELKTELKSDIKGLKADVHELKTDVGELKKDVRVLKDDMVMVKKDIRDLKSDMRVVKHDVKDLQKRQDKTDEKVDQIIDGMLPIIEQGAEHDIRLQRLEHRPA